MDLRTFSFSCLNPQAAQSPTPITISATDGTTPLVSRLMDVDTADAYGVVQGTSVLNIVEVSLSVTSTQICPLVGVLNYMAFSFTSNVVISAESRLTITGLTGTQTPTSLTCFQLDPYPDGNRFGPSRCASWIRDSGTMSLTLQGELLPNVANDVSFTLTNPSSPQSSPPLWANGTIRGVSSPSVPSPQDAVISRVQVDKDLVLQPFSVAGGARVLYIVLPALTESSVVQSSMLPGDSNTIAVVLTFNCDLPALSKVTLSGLTATTRRPWRSRRPTACWGPPPRGRPTWC